MPNQDLKHWITLFAGVVIAIAGQADAFPEPYRHYISLAGIIATAIGGYHITPTGSTKDGERFSAPTQQHNP